MRSSYRSGRATHFCRVATAGTIEGFTAARLAFPPNWMRKAALTAFQRWTNMFSFFRDSWTHRVLIWRLSRREVQARFRGSFLGAFWAVILPLIMLGVFSLF